MKFARRQILQSLGAAIAGPVLSHAAWALDYPTRPVTVVVPFAAGSAPDIGARLLGSWLSERLGQPFVIENRPGAGGNLGTEAVVRAPADGHTLLAITAANMIAPSLYTRLRFDFVRDIAPVASTGRFPIVIAVHPSLPVKSIPELIEYSRGHNRDLNEGSLTGASSHLAGQLFKMTTGANIVHVPYRGGGAAMPDLLSGQLQVSFDTAPLLVAYVRTGQLRALAVTTALRWNGLPDVPAVSEFVPNFEVSPVSGYGVPRGTPAEIIDKLNSEINAALRDPKIKARLEDLGGTVLAGSPADFGKLIVAEIEKWSRVVEFAGIKGD